MSARPLVAVERPEPRPGAGEIRIRVSARAVCRTDLHLAEGDLGRAGSDRRGQPNSAPSGDWRDLFTVTIDKKR